MTYITSLAGAATPQKPMEQLLGEAMAAFGCTMLGGKSGDGWSGVADLQRCPRRYQLLHESRLVPRDYEGRRALSLGSLVHLGLACHYARFLPEGYPGWQPNLPPPLDILDKVQELGGDPLMCQQARTIVGAYLEYYINDDLTPVAVEMKAGIDGVHTCRYDLLAWKDGSLWACDHKCLPGDARIWTTEGVVDAETAARERPRQLPTLLVGASDEPVRVWDTQPVLGTTKRGRTQDIYQITTEFGHSERFGFKHPILTKRGGAMMWIPARDVRCGDKIAVALGHGAFAGPSPCSPNFLYALGALVLDGALTNASCTYTKTSPAHRAWFSRAVRAIGDKAFARPVRRGKAPYMQIKVGSQLASFVRAFGMNVRSSEKRLPGRLLALPRQEAGALLGGLFAGDGSVAVHVQPDTYGKARKAVRICYGSRSRGLCRDIATLLLSLGIPTSLCDTSVKYKGARRGYHYATVISREGKRRFLDLIDAGVIAGPQLKQESKRCRRVLDSKRGDDPCTLDIEGSIWWVPVETNLMTGREVTYDVSMPRSHNFVAGPFVTHNTTSRETVDVLEGWWLDGEIIGEVYAYKLSKLEEQFGAPITGVIINLLVKSKVPRFRRIEVVIPRKVLESYERSLRFWKDQRARFRHEGFWPRALHGCTGRYDGCLYWSHCRDENADLLVPNEE